jgi:hypothetical protein
VASPSPSVAMAATYQANMPPLEIPKSQVGYGVSNSRVNFLIDFITKMSIEYASWKYIYILHIDIRVANVVASTLKTLIFANC